MGTSCTFQRAQSRTVLDSKLDAEFTAKRLTRPLKSSDYASMQAGWENRWWKLDDKHIPARSYLEERCDELEGGDFHVESLTKVISREEDSEPSVQTFFDGTGKLQIKKCSTEVALPTTPEQLRYRVKLCSTGIQMIGIEHSNQTSHLKTSNYLSFLLGEFVWGLTGKASEGLRVSAPAWGQLLIDEQQIRKRIYNLLLEGTPAVDALKSAFKDPVVKEARARRKIRHLLSVQQSLGDLHSLKLPVCSPLLQVWWKTTSCRFQNQGSETQGDGAPAPPAMP